MLSYYYDLMSQPSRALYIFLKLTKLPVKFVKIDLSKGEHLTDEYAAINRFQKVPCIIDENGFKLSESVAIFRYLMATRSDIPEKWYPKNVQERALIDEYLEWQHNNTRFACAMYFQMKYLIPRLSGNPVDEEKLIFFKNYMEQCLDTLENVWLKDENKAFLASNHLTLADILAACELEQPKMASYDPFDERPNLSRWYERVKKETSPYYEEAHVIVNKIIQKNSTKSKL